MKISFYRTIWIMMVTAGLCWGFTSCKKYADDSTYITFTEPDKRIINRWTYNFVTENGQDVTPSFQTYNLIFESQNRLTKQYMDTINNEPIPTVDYGNWRLKDNDKRVELNFDNFTEDYEILELTKSTMTLRSVNLLENRLIYLKSKN